MTELAEKILLIHASLDAAEVMHAFGGALALAFHTEEPRGTRDIDVNLFCPPGDVDASFAALPEAVGRSSRDRKAVLDTGQVRLFWGDTPVDLFFSTAPFHDEAARDLLVVPFAGDRIPVLGATHLLVFKALFDRTKDWADIEAMLEARPAVGHPALGWLVDLLGADDHRVDRLQALVRADRRC